MGKPDPYAHLDQAMLRRFNATIKTMKKYRIRYTEDAPGHPIYSCDVFAHDKEHAKEQFFASPDGEDWEILSIQPRERFRGGGAK